MNRDLLIQIALDEAGKPVRPLEAERGRRYTCIECGTELILRLGNIRVHHFAHKTKTINCSGESRQHKEAKHLIKLVIEDWIKGKGSKPEIFTHCYNCRKRLEETLPDTITRVELEHPYLNRRPDVLLFEDLIPSRIVEIHHTNEVTPEKAEDIDIPYYELNCGQVLKDPQHWIPTNMNDEEYLCPLCRKELTEEIASQNENPPIQSITNSKIKESTKKKPINQKQKVYRRKSVTGFCIRCGEQIARNASYPLCERCFEIWDRYRNPLHEERYCHYCGNNCDVTKAKPLCTYCYWNSQEFK